MSFCWAEYLIIARFLQTAQHGASPEAGYRSAVSRAYYAAFCHARDYARDRLGYRSTYDPRDHPGVRAYLANHELGSLSLKLDTLRQWRNSCDYDDVLNNVAFLPMMTTSAISDAEDVLVKLG